MPQALWKSLYMHILICYQNSYFTNKAITSVLGHITGLRKSDNSSMNSALTNLRIWALNHYCTVPKKMLISITAKPAMLSVPLRSWFVLWDNGRNLLHPPDTRFFSKMILTSWSGHSLNKLQFDNVSPAPPAVICTGQVAKGLKGSGSRLPVAGKVCMWVFQWAVAHTGRLAGTSDPRAQVQGRKWTGQRPGHPKWTGPRDSGR